MNTELKTETIWESPGKNHNGDPFLSVKRSRGYYYYAERVGQDSVAFILYDDIKKYGLILESKPPMDERNSRLTNMCTAFGGSIDSNSSKEEIVQQEVREEAGYKVELENIYSVGKTMVSTQMSQMCHLYIVDVTGIDKTETAEYETEDGDVVWLDPMELMENSDWKSIFIFTKNYFNNQGKNNEFKGFKGLKEQSRITELLTENAKLKYMINQARVVKSDIF